MTRRMKVPSSSSRLTAAHRRWAAPIIALACFVALPGGAYALSQATNSSPAAAYHSAPHQPRLERYSYTQAQMGLPFRVTLYAQSEKQARQAARAALARVGELNQIFSDYEYDSELDRLSRTAGQGKAIAVSPDLWKILEQAQTLSRRTDGAFDVTVGPLVGLWREARRRHRLPEARRIQQAQKAVGYRKLRLDPSHRTVELTVPGMHLDLGGIAKGYALDAALEVLRRRGITRALVTGSGDMALGAAPPGRPGWRIELAPLDAPHAPPPRFVVLTNCALATSGDMFQRLNINGVRYSHIVNPHTGVGLTNHSMVTVIAPNCRTADSFATAISVLGPKRGLALARQTPGVAVQILCRPGKRVERFATPNLHRYEAK